MYTYSTSCLQVIWKAIHFQIYRIKYVGTTTKRPHVLYTIHISSSPTTMENYCEKIEMKDEDKMRLPSISPILSPYLQVIHINYRESACENYFRKPSGIAALLNELDVKLPSILCFFAWNAFIISWLGRYK